MSELQRVVILFAGISDQQTGRELVIAVSNLTGCLIPWIRQSPEDLIVAHVSLIHDVFRF